MIKKTALTQKPLKVALVHDYLTEFGGAERVLEAFHTVFPQAPVYTAFFNQKSLGDHAARFQGWDIRETFLKYIPFFHKLYSPLRFLAPWAFGALDLSEYDLVISSSNAYFAKAVRVPRGLHICYCHTPPRVLYGYSAMMDWKRNPFMRVGGQLLNHVMRVIDVQVSRERVDVFVANSYETASRIKKFYKRDAVVVYPPVTDSLSYDDVKQEKVASLKSSNQSKASSLLLKQPSKKKPRNFFLYVNRLALAKHPEIAVQACTKLNLPLKVVGMGKMLPYLQAQAGSTVEFLGGVPDEELKELYESAKALLYPVEQEDFGMVPVEAMVQGTPVIAHNSGGPRETVLEGKTGVLFDDLSVEGLTEAIKRWEKISFDENAIKKWSQRFSLEAFQKGITQVIVQHMTK